MKNKSPFVVRQAFMPLSPFDKRGTFHMPLRLFLICAAHTVFSRAFYARVPLGLDTLLVSVDHLLDHLTAYGTCFS